MNQSAEMTAENDELAPVPKGAWRMLVVLLVLSAATVVCQLKTASIQPLLMEDLGMNVATVGWLASAFSLAGLLVAIPAPAVINRFGLKNTGLLAALALALGSLLGAVTANVAVLLVTRLLEGIGAGLGLVVVPAAIADWFPGKHRGLAMGIWTADMPVGGIIALIGAPIIAQSAGWRGVWWFTLAISVVTFLLVLLFFRNPSAAAVPAARQSAEQLGRRPSQADALRKPNMWWLAVIYLLQNLIIAGAVMTYYPTFLNANRGMSLTAAGSLTAINAVGMLIFGPIAGAVVDRVGAVKILKWVVIGDVIAVALSFLLSPVWAITICSFMIGVLSSALPTSVYTLTPAALGEPRLIPAGMGLLGVVRNLGSFVGPLVMGALILWFGWMPAAWTMVVLMAIAIVASFSLKLGDRSASVELVQPVEN
ncbi:MAG: nitrate/nitrite transporter [Coriobacteriia bacterium]